MMLQIQQLLLTGLNNYYMKKYITILIFLISTISLYSQKQFIETSESELTLSCGTNSIFEILLKNNITLYLNGISGSKSITIWLVQDYIGGRTVKFSNQFTFTSLNNDSVIINANAVTVLEFKLNNNRVYCSYNSTAKGISGEDIVIDGLSVDQILIHKGIIFDNMLSIESASTIIPTKLIFHVTGTTQINTISVSGFTAQGNTRIIYIVPDAIFTFGTSGNIAIASTAVVKKMYTMVYDAINEKWYPSY
jgi:hypothetical protein